MSDHPDDTTTHATRVGQPPGGLAGAGHSCLVVLRGPQLGRRIPLAEGVVTLGRSSVCEAVLRQHDVSRQHCQIEIREGHAFLRDLGSTNGTLIAGRLLPRGEDFLLRGGDLIQVGDCVLKYLEEGALEAGYHEEVYRSMMVDGLTQVYNRRFLVEQLDREIARCRRHRRSLGLILLDIDHFKRVNDRFGHPAGDELLRLIATGVKEQLRQEAWLARYGGEEFAVVLPETELRGARACAERIRAAVEALTPTFDGAPREVTLSAGVTCWQPSHRTVEDLLRAADEMLYRAKDRGRNRVEG